MKKYVNIFLLFCLSGFISFFMFPFALLAQDYSFEQGMSEATGDAPIVFDSFFKCEARSTNNASTYEDFYREVTDIIPADFVNIVTSVHIVSAMPTKGTFSIEVKPGIGIPINKGYDCSVKSTTGAKVYDSITITFNYPIIDFKDKFWGSGYGEYKIDNNSITLTRYSDRPVGLSGHLYFSDEFYIYVLFVV